MGIRINFFLLLCCSFLFPKINSAHQLNKEIYILSHDTLFVIDSADFSIQEQNFNSFKKERPTPLLQRFHIRQKKNKKLTAAILAFPFPFGIVGLHRIYLGTAPYVPVVYIASFGGVLGLLPLIDFCFILLDKETETFINNKKVFMWVK